jgi:hypothetical protein
VGGYFAFRYGDKHYANDGNSAGNGSSVISSSIDPSTGMETTEPPQEIIEITSGYAEWTVDGAVARFEFDLRFADGKTAKGSGKVPLSEIETY